MSRSRPLSITSSTRTSLTAVVTPTTPRTGRSPVGLPTTCRSGVLLKARWKKAVASGSRPRSTSNPRALPTPDSAGVFISSFRPAMPPSRFAIANATYSCLFAKSSSPFASGSLYSRAQSIMITILISMMITSEARIGHVKEHQRMSIRTSLPSRLTGGATMLAASLALANQDAIHLPDVTVVSATGFAQKITDATASISVISREQLQSKPYAGLADAQRDVEGVDVGADLDKNGNISITMRGLPKDYTLVLIDGRRQSDIGDIGPNNFGNSQFMYMPSMDAIERIEVIRGPMSTLYCADAMGGVINIITRKVQDSWGGSISHGISIQEDSQFGDDRKTDLFASGPLIEGLLGLGLRASLYDREQ